MKIHITTSLHVFIYLEPENESEVDQLARIKSEADSQTQVLGYNAEPCFSCDELKPAFLTLRLSKKQ